ncbi:hypothetical protein Tco_0139127 [Tanacetum coccineum]
MTQMDQLVHEYDNSSNNEIFNMFTQEEQYTELLEPISEPHQVQQNDNNVISAVSSVEQSGGIVEQNPATVEETRAYFESLYNNIPIEVEKVNMVNQKIKETNADLTTELICLGVDLEPDEWIKDSGCSKHMTGNQKLFSTYKAYNRGNVIFGSNIRGNIIGKGQICDNKCRVNFSEHDSEITKDGKVIGRGIRKKGLYVMKLGNKPKDKICLATIDENSTL